MVYNLTDLKHAMDRLVLDKLDHKNIDRDVADFVGVSTAENIAIYIWDLLKPVLADLLYEVRLQETENNIVIYRGE
jgi:6-pyruvoyltetrahydropterin/6-carboxytetrahydropterin synthase